MIRIVVPGAPVGKGRPRFVRARGIAYTPAKTANYEAILAAAGAEAMGEVPCPDCENIGYCMTCEGAGIIRPMRAPFDCSLEVCVTAFMPIPRSWSRKKQQAALEGAIRPGKPDADNILKTLDALNNIVWRDDSQIAEARVSKLYDEAPRLEIEVQPL